MYLKYKYSASSTPIRIGKRQAILSQLNGKIPLKYVVTIISNMCHVSKVTIVYDSTPSSHYNQFVFKYYVISHLFFLLYLKVRAC